MLHRCVLTALVLLLTGNVAGAAGTDRPGWSLTFQDEFDGVDLDQTRWVKRFKWGEARINNELQAYVDDAFELKDGVLSIVGERRAGTYAGQTFEYRSGMISSVQEQKYGYFEARLKVPAGQGLWPAFWLLGKVGADGVNEIDIHEILGHQPSTVHMTVHWGTDYNTGHQSSGSTWNGPDFSTESHVFGVEWTSDSIVWTIDGVERKRYTGPGVPQVEMYVILNLAIGGSWPGAPSATTVFPARYEIDYVRAYERLPANDDAGDHAPSDAGIDASNGVAVDGEDGACGCRAPAGPQPSLALVLAGLALLLGRRRR